MFDFTESIRIEAPRQHVWDVIRDLDTWWTPSNPEHLCLEHLDDRPVTEVGARLRIRERIGGVPGEAVGVVTTVEPGRQVSWEADATYRWFGISVPIEEGVTWHISGCGDTAAEVSAHVWAGFPQSGFGWLAAELFTRLLNGVAKDRAHTRAELEYLKSIIETPGGQRC
jgi:Polyketide cyclase / dehydrase and lipid transport